jgi:hypothetical protein
MAATEPNGKTALFISPDLLIGGKIQSAAEPLGIGMLQASELKRIEAALAENRVSIVFFDLNLASPAIADVMALLPENPRPFLVAFGPHVNTARLEEARLAGCDRVLPRSRFAVELPELLTHAMDAD